MDTNQLQTALNVAIAGEDYALAAAIRDAIAAQREEGMLAPPADWRQLGVPEWLAERAERLGFRCPTEVQRRAAPVIIEADDCIVRSATGSGKTMAFVVPALARLDYPPTLLPEDLEGPELVILVPTRELGVQVVMLVYKLLGGSVNKGIPGEASNMFAYSGPRGIKVRGMLLDDEVEMAWTGGYTKGVHVLVATPQLLASCLEGQGAPDVFHDTKVVVVDEVDECFKEAPDEMAALLGAACTRPPPLPEAEGAAEASSSDGGGGGGLEAGGRRGGGKPQLVFVGATVQEGVADHAVERGWMGDPVSITVGMSSVPRGLVHRYMVVEPAQKLAVMARQMRSELRQQSEDAPPARVMVFAKDEVEARALAEPLRNVLWGDHTISVLLPGGDDPIRALHAFRDNVTTLLLATPAAARGLDLPAVGHVYNLDLPADGATGYLHRAGRAGRIGSPVKGVVTTLVTREQLPALQQMASELGVELREETPPAVEPLPSEVAEGDPAALESLRKGFEDLYNMF